MDKTLEQLFAEADLIESAAEWDEIWADFDEVAARVEAYDG